MAETILKRKLKDLIFYRASQGSAPCTYFDARNIFFTSVHVFPFNTVRF